MPTYYVLIPPTIDSEGNTVRDTGVFTEEDAAPLIAKGVLEAMPLNDRQPNLDRTPSGVDEELLKANLRSGLNGPLRDALKAKLIEAMAVKALEKLLQGGMAELQEELIDAAVAELQLSKKTEETPIATPAKAKPKPE